MYQFYIFSNPHKPFTRRIFFINCFSRCRNRINILWCSIFHAVHSRITFINAEGRICTREIAENTPLQLLQPRIRDYVTTSITSAKSFLRNSSISLSPSLIVPFIMPFIVSSFVELPKNIYWWMAWKTWWRNTGRFHYGQNYSQCLWNTDQRNQSAKNIWYEKVKKTNWWNRKIIHFCLNITIKMCL